MADPDFTSWPEISVKGSALPDAQQYQLGAVVVDHHQHLPAMFALCFHDDADALRKGGLEIGVEITIKAKGLGSSTATALITGEVTAIEAEYSELCAETVVRGYDRSHRLQAGRVAKTYQNEKISDVAGQMASNAGLSAGTIDDSGGALPVVTQHNVSDWEFLRSHARELGFEVSVENGKLDFRRPTKASTGPAKGGDNPTNPLQLVFGDNLLEFRPRLTGGQQVKEVQVRTWDPATKNVLLGTAPADAGHAAVSTTPAALAGTLSGKTYVAHDRPLATQGDTETAAKSIAEHIGSAFLEAEGTALGQPALKAGVAVSIAGVAEQFSGKYTLTTTRHVFDEDGYRTHFTISGRQERSLLGLTSIGATSGFASGGGPPVHGTVIGVVTQNDDKDELGRVKLKFPWLSDTYETDWTRVVQVGAGPNSGAVFLPEVGDEVLCAFEFGDMRRPYVIGGLHNGKDKPNLGKGLVDAGKVTRRGVVSRLGHKVILMDGDQKAGICLITADGKLKVTLNQTKGEIHITGAGPMTIDAGSGGVTIKGQGDIALQAGGNLSLKGTQGVKVESSGIVEVKGNLIKLN